MAWPIVKKRVNRQSTSWMVDCGMVDGKRKRFFFKSKVEAETKADLLRIDRRNVGLAAFALTDADREEAAKCLKLLAPYGKTLRDAVDFYLPHIQTLQRTLPVREFVSEFLKARKEDSLRPRYIQDLSSRLNAFSRTFGQEMVASITSPLLDDWLRGLKSKSGAKLSPTSRNNFRRVLRVAFSYAVSREYCAVNPVLTTAKVKERKGAVGILSVDEMSQLLLKCPPILVPFIAIGAFAGLRRVELVHRPLNECAFIG